ncbi:hypothetical protein DEO72_LG1g2637 [Vigna unguiculata]|uniref:Uncharacterized protein n=1 Tax=Vigna unguiculata TaxID=3917 RepID=A0A4D6KQQ5_VIGUN|nr:hypothetical protein DEO72_LG1g2637 [Vigna unguiculata]
MTLVSKYDDEYVSLYVLNSRGNSLKGIHKLVDPSLEESYLIESVLKTLNELKAKTPQKGNFSGAKLKKSGKK